MGAERHPVIKRACRRQTTPVASAERPPSQSDSDGQVKTPQGSIGINMSPCFFTHPDQHRIATRM
jgi:hypothetical protein